MERRLAAILAADVVGYTRLMGRDEEGTLQRLTQLREDILEPLVTEHGGRIVKLMGDGFLVEFASVVDSVTCALAWQEMVSEHEAGEDTENRILFRIGINLGDIIIEESDIYGDGVNIAARLEGLSNPGGICLSGDSYRQTKGKVDAEFGDMGEQTLKNVEAPVRVYRIVSSSEIVEQKPGEQSELALPDKPSIAVLPFDNMSGDPDQEYFVDGIAEDIITALSKVSGLFVIARNSTFTYKGQAVNMQEVSTALGVKYVLEGSVRKAGGRVRITAQLIEGASSGHLWAERYDRELVDIFAVQDEVTQQIVNALEVQLGSGESERMVKHETGDLRCYDRLLRGRELFMRFTK